MSDLDVATRHQILTLKLFAIATKYKVDPTSGSYVHITSAGFWLGGCKIWAVWTLDFDYMDVWLFGRWISVDWTLDFG